MDCTYRKVLIRLVEKIGMYVITIYLSIAKNSSTDWRHGVIWYVRICCASRETHYITNLSKYHHIWPMLRLTGRRQRATVVKDLVLGETPRRVPKTGRQRSVIKILCATGMTASVLTTAHSLRQPQPRLSDSGLLSTTTVRPWVILSALLRVIRGLITVIRGLSYHPQFVRHILGR